MTELMKTMMIISFRRGNSRRLSDCQSWLRGRQQFLVIGAKLGWQEGISGRSSRYHRRWQQSVVEGAVIHRVDDRQELVWTVCWQRTWRLWRQKRPWTVRHHPRRYERTWHVVSTQTIMWRYHFIPFACPAISFISLIQIKQMFDSSKLNLQGSAHYLCRCTKFQNWRFLLYLKYSSIFVLL